MRPFDLTGFYFELLETVNPVDLALYDGDRVLAKASQVEAGYYVDRSGAELRPFNRIEITTGASETIKFLVTDGRAGSRRSYVLALSGERQRSLLGKAFIAHAYASPTAATYAHGQLWNPVGSGVNAFVTRVMLNAVTAAGVVYLTSHNAALATLVGLPKNKNLSLTDNSGLRVYTDNLGAITGSHLIAEAVLLNVPFMVPLNEPILVPPGYGLNASFGTVNQGVDAVWDLFVEPTT